MTHFQRLKNEARRAEQRSNWLRAIDLYKEAIRVDEEEGGSPSDIGIYNRVGDLYLRQGDARSAVEYYDRAVDRYTDHDLTSSAIALCNKILRITPERDEIYRKLGRLHASTGLVAEARGNFLEFAARVESADGLGDALEALQEFVDLTGDEGIRVAFAERLVDRGRAPEALAQLRLAYEAHVARGSGTNEILARMLAIDPSADPRVESSEGVPPAPPVVAEAVVPAHGKLDPETGSSATATTPVVEELPTAPSVPGRQELQVRGDGYDPEREPLERPSFDERPPPGEGTTGEAPPRAAGASSARGGLDDPEEIGSILTRFRSQVRAVVEETDYAVHYDLGVAYMGMGLLNEAIEEFQHAIQSPLLLDAAHSLLGRCLAIKSADVSESPADRSGEALQLLTPAEELASAATAAGRSEEDEAPVELADEAAGDLTGASDRVAEPPTDEPAGGAAEEAGEEDQTDALAELLFKARLAQYRMRQAESEHHTDHAAHLELGATYLQMGLVADAIDELRAAADGPRGIAAKATDALETIVSSLEVEESDRAAAARALRDGGLLEEAVGRLRVLHEDLTRSGSDAAPVRRLIRELDPGAGVGTDPGRVTSTPDAEVFPVRSASPTTSPSTADQPAVRDAREGGIRRAGQTADDLPPETVTAAPPPAAPPPPAPAVSEPDRILAQALADLDADETERAVQKLYRALQLFERGRQIRRAAEVLDRLLQLRPDDVVLHHQRSEFAIMTNDRPALIRSYVDLASCLRRQNAPRSARTVYGRILDVDPENETALEGLQRLDEAELQREQRARLDRSGASLSSLEPMADESGAADAGLRARSAFRSSDGGRIDPEDRSREFDAMLEDLRSQLPTAPAETSEDHESRYELGIAFKQMTMFDEAIRELQAAVSGLDDPLPAYEALGECFLALERFGTARKVLSLADALPAADVEKVGVLYFLAIACQNSGADAEAREYFERVCAVDISFRDAADRLSSISR